MGLAGHRVVACALAALLAGCYSNVPIDGTTLPHAARSAESERIRARPEGRAHRVDLAGQHVTLESRARGVRLDLEHVEQLYVEAGMLHLEARGGDPSMLPLADVDRLVLSTFDTVRTVLVVLIPVLLVSLLAVGVGVVATSHPRIGPIVGW